MNIDTNLLIGVATPALAGLLAVVFRTLVRRGLIGLRAQVTSLVKDRKVRDIIFKAIIRTEQIIVSKRTENKIKLAAIQVKAAIPGKFDDVVIDALIEAIYAETSR